MIPLWYLADIRGRNVIVALDVKNTVLGHICNTTKLSYRNKVKFESGPCTVYKRRRSSWTRLQHRWFSTELHALAGLLLPTCDRNSVIGWLLQSKSTPPGPSFFTFPQSKSGGWRRADVSSVSHTEEFSGSACINRARSWMSAAEGQVNS